MPQQAEVEAPVEVEEVPVGFRLAELAGPALPTIPPGAASPQEARDFYAFARRPTRRLEQGPASAALGDQQSLRVELALARASEPPPCREERGRAAGRGARARRRARARVHALPSFTS